MDQLTRDFVFSIRQITKHWGVSLVVVLSIALGVSANSVVFGWVDALILDPLPAVKDTSSLYAFSSKTQSGDYIDSSYADFVDYREGLSDLGDLMLYKSWPVSLENNGKVERAPALLVSRNYFDALGLQPAAGRFFRKDDLIEVADGKPVVVISYDYWKSRYGMSPGIVGETLVLNQLPYTIVGVAPQKFSGLDIGGGNDLWLPLMQMSRLSGESNYWIEDRKTRPFAGMLRADAGVTKASVRSRLDVIAARLQSAYPNTNTAITSAVFPFIESPDGGPSDLSLLLSVLFFASVIVLGIICANLVNLLLARASDRDQEIGIRKAIGSGGAGIIRLFLVEGVSLSIIAALVSIVAVHLMYGFLRFFAPDIELPVSGGLGMSTTLILYTTLLALLTGLLISILPAMRAASVKVDDVLKESSRGSSMGRRNRYLRTVLIVSQVALAFVALAGAGSFIKSFNRITDIDLGFDTEHVHLTALTPTGPINEREQLINYTDELRAAMQQLPGVSDVAFAEYVPLGFSGGSWEDINVRGYTPRLDESMKVYRNFVSEQYFNVMDIDLVDGRNFNTQDGNDSDLVAIVNETFAERYFSDREAIGRIIVGWGSEIKVIGVARDSKYRSPTETSRPYLYLSFRQFARTGDDTIMHTRLLNPDVDISPFIRDKVDQSGSLLYVSWMSSLQKFTSASVFNERILAVLLSLLGVTALVLSALGIYSVVSHSVSQRTHEIGVRVALGASAIGVMKMILIQSLKVVVTGLIIGILLYLFMWQGIQDMLYGGDGMEFSTLLIVSVILITLAVAAIIVPSIRIGKLDPVKALQIN